MWTLPEGDADFSKRWGVIKATYTKCIVAAGLLDAGVPVWQQRFWEHSIRVDGDFAAHVDYVYINAVKHGLVSRVADWPWSSFHRDVQRGLYPANWGGDVAVDELRQYGEPNDS